MSTTTASTNRAPTATERQVTNNAAIRIYDTLTKTKKPFEPVTPGKVGIYLCGPTVYKESHIGHMVGPVIFDCIKRYLVYCGYETTWVVNITDVDDKLIAEANKRGITMAEVADENVADYMSNLAALGVESIDHMPRATECMDGIIVFIESLVEKGFAYASDGDVYFDVTQDESYGKLSNRSLDHMQGDGGGMALRKRSPGDFALWKTAKEGEPSWKSPWGEGRPGWHIECSAMSRQLLGETFDIHGGGLDLVFPHHENEIAQSECCHRKPMANYWMHNGLMKAAAAGKVGGRTEREKEAAEGSGKISRSEGAGGLADLIGRQGGERIRFFLLRTHYRSTIVFSEEGIEEAGTGLDTFYRFFERYERVTSESFFDMAAPTQRAAGEIPPTDDPLLSTVAERRDSFLNKMDDDFNSGAAMSDLFELVRTLNKFIDQHDLEEQAKRDEKRLASLKSGTVALRELTGILGLFQSPLESANCGDDQLAGGLMELIIRLRATARENKDFAMADMIRDGLGKLDITLEDRKDGTDWSVNK